MAADNYFSCEKEEFSLSNVSALDSLIKGVSADYVDDISLTIAEHLNSNHVIAFPCDIGTPVYLTSSSGKVYESKIEAFRVVSESMGYSPVEMLIDNVWGNIAHIGNTVFFSREEALKKMADKK